ncbi:MAG TPA: hypothetical protein VGL07_04995 [Buttiauxella sp.]
MSSYDITVGRIQACTRSTVDFIVLVSDIETALLTIHALERCGIADDVDADGFPSRIWEIIWIAEQFGYACESGLIPDYLFQKYVTELVLPGHATDAHAWNYGFRKGAEAVYYY